MVDETHRRLAPADDPSKYRDFGLWLRRSTESNHGLKAALADYCGVSPQRVQKWLNGSIPAVVKLRLVAEWARVSFDALRDLVDRHAEDRAERPKKPAKTLQSTKIRSRPPGRSVS